MGLTNEERIHKIYFAISKISDLGKQLEVEEFRSINRYKRIKDYCELIWKTFFCSEGNSCFWIFGSNEEVSFTNSTIWSVALYQNIKFCKKETKEDKKEFNPFDNILSIEGLLNKNNKIIYNLYCWVQQLQYAINRYTDELSEKFKPILEIAGSIFGEIFALFYEEKEFAKVWIIHEICKKLYNGEFLLKNPDELVSFMLNEYCHYKISRYKKELWYLKNLLNKLEKNSSIKNRTLILIELISEDLVKHSNDQKKLRMFCEKIGLNFEKKVLPILKKVKIRDFEKEQREEYVKNKKIEREELLK